MNRKAFLYVRVSTQEQATEGYSIDEQLSRLNGYCNSLGWIVVDSFIDGGYSGANTNRPALKRLISACNDRLADCVVVYKLDRLSRSQKDTLALIEDSFLANNVDFISMTENFDTSTPFGKAMIGILSVFAQLEREQIKERMAMGKEGRAKSGKYHGGGYIPVGYEYTDGELIVNNYEAMQIQEIHSLYQSGESFRNIAKIMNDKGYSQKYGSWQVKRVRQVLLSPLYMGMISHKGETIPGTHQPIISPECFDKTNQVYQNRNTKSYKNRGKTTLLGGLLYCGQCGARYGIHRHRKGEKVFSYYGCHSRRKNQRHLIKDANCKNKTYHQEELESIVINEIKKLAINPEQLHLIATANKDTEKPTLIQSEIKKLEAKKNRFVDLYGEGIIPSNELQLKVADVDSQIEKLNLELANIKTPELSERDALGLVASFTDLFDNGNFEQVRALISALISKIEIDNDNITIYWRFS